MGEATNIKSEHISSVLSAVQNLAPKFRERVPATEAARTVPRESVDELLNAGVARMMVPIEFGGLDMRLRDLCEVTAAAARGCPSTGWITCLMAGLPHSFALFSPEAQKAVWADGPDVIGVGSLGVTAKKVDGGYRISGRSPFSSGVNNASWAFVAGPVPSDAGPPEIRFFLFRLADCEIIDTWDMAAMRGTGSNTIVITDLFIPDAFTVSAPDMREGSGPGAAGLSNPAFQLPWSAYSSLGFVSTLLGTAEGAFEEVVTLLKEKKDPAGRRAVDSEVQQVGVGMAAAQIRTARTVILTAADRADSDPHFDTLERATAMLNFSYAAKLLKQALDGLLELAGTSGFATSSMIQQFWRDGNFAAAHQGLNSRLLAGYYGRLKLEVEDPQRPMFY